MIRRPPSSTLFPLHDALPISPANPVVVAHLDDLDDEQWHELRARGIGGSDAAAIAGLHPYKSPFADRKSTRLNSSHANISYAVFCLKKKKPNTARRIQLVLTS